MDYSNVLTLHALEGEVLAMVTWFSDEQATLSEAKKVAKELMKNTNWFELCFSSGHVSGKIPTFLVIEENQNYGESN